MLCSDGGVLYSHQHTSNAFFELPDLAFKAETDWLWALKSVGSNLKTVLLRATKSIGTGFCLTIQPLSGLSTYLYNFLLLLLYLSIYLSFSFFLL